MTKVELAGTLKVKLPSISVIVPLPVFPFCTTEAPITVSPVLSFTVPFTVTFCADTLSDIMATNKNSSAVRMFFILDILCMFVY